MKKILSIVLCLIMITTLFSVISIPAFALSGTSGDCTWKVIGTTLTISGNGEMPNFSSDGHIGSHPWYGFTTVIIYDGVTNIGNNAFDNCVNLENIVIPSSVKTIGEGAFRICTAMQSIKLPDSIISIGERAFEYCSNLLSIKIPDSVKSLGQNIFAGCSNLQKVTLGNGITSISDFAFDGCYNLINLNIGDNVISIGAAAFSGCTGLQSVTLGNGLKNLGGFSSCKSLKSIVIPDSVETIENGAFCDCTSLESITIGNGVRSIDTYAFSNTAYYNNESNWEDNILYIGAYLIDTKSPTTDYTIKEGTKCIANDAFNYRALHSITIPDSVTSIGWSAFYNCQNLKNIIIGNNITHMGGGAFYNTAYYNDESNWENGVLYLGKSLIDARIISGDYSIKEGTKCIADYAFESSSDLKSINIPNSVTSIGLFAFSGCYDMHTITMGSGVTSISKYAFSSCTNIKDIYYLGTITQWNSLENKPEGTVHFTCENTGHVYDDENDPSCNICGQINEDRLDSGDINGDNSVDDKDITSLKRYLAGWSVIVFESKLDINSDGIVDDKDASHLAKYLAGWTGYEL